MARKSATILLSDLSTNFPDNTSGEITPAVYRTFMTDVINASAPGAAAMTGTTSTTVTVNEAQAKLEIFDTNAGEAGGVATVDAANDQITIIEGGFYRVGARLSAQFPSTRDLTLYIDISGTPSGFSASGAGRGNNKPVSITMSGGLIFASPGDIVSMHAYADSDNTSVESINAFLILERVAMS